MKRSLAVLLGVLVCLATLQAGGEVDKPQVDSKAAPAAGGKYKEAPELAQLVRAGKLPPVDQRLPGEPLVLKPVEKVGKYGGSFRGVFNGMADTAVIDRAVAYEQLVRWDPLFREPIPNLARKVDVSPDATVFKFTLREGIRWSDGQPLTADDYVYWYQEVILNKELNPSVPRWLRGSGAPPVLEKIDTYTFQFRFAKPNSLFLLQLVARDATRPAPKHYMKQFHPGYAPKDELVKKAKDAKFDTWVQYYQNRDSAWTNADRPVLWAWRVVTPADAGTRCVLKRNPYYWKVDTAGNQLPYIDEVVFDIVTDEQVMWMQAMAGEITMQKEHIGDQVQNFPMFVENQEKGKYKAFRVVTTLLSDVCLYFNLNHKDPVKNKVFNDRRFRIAVSHAIDRKRIADVIYLGQAEGRQPAPLKESPFYYEPFEKAFTELKPEISNKLLDEMGMAKRDAEGFRLGPDGKPFSFLFEVQTGRKLFRIDACEMMKQDLAKVGVRAIVKPIDRSLWNVRVKASDHDCAIFGGGEGIQVLLDARPIIPINADAYHAQEWVKWYESGKGIEPPAPVKKQLALYDQITQTADLARQVQLFQEILKISAEELYVVGIVAEQGNFAIHKANLRNVLTTPYMWSSITQDPARINPCQFFFE